MKIAGITVAYNEGNMVKYVMPYYEKMGIDKLIVYDNMSTDDMCEKLSKYPFVEIRHFDTNGKFDDRKNSDLKEEVSYELLQEGYDWVYTGDFDEIVYCEGDFKKELEKIEELGGTVLCRDMIQPFNPLPYDFDETKLIHEQCTHFLTWHDWSSTWGGSKVLLRSKKVPKIKLSLGAHGTGFPKKGIETDPVLFGYPFITFHLKYVDFTALEHNSHEKHARIQWRLDVPTCTAVDASFTKRLYSRTMGDAGIKNTIDKLMKKTSKLNIAPGWESFKEYYDKNYKMNMTKFKNIKHVKRLDYEQNS